FRQSFKSRQTGTTGEVVNLQSIDAGKFQLSVQFLHMIWSAPLQMVIALVELIILVQWAGLAGFAILVLSVPLSTVLGRKMAAGSKELMDMK
ncbi:ABC transporter transmembrane domain-containing protein, partial [Acinetobacter baumannii]